MLINDIHNISNDFGIDFQIINIDTYENQNSEEYKKNIVYHLQEDFYVRH